MLPIQILLIAIFSVVIIKIIMRSYRGELSLVSALSWIIFWLLSAAIVAQPNLTSAAARLFGVGRGADVVIYFALVALFFMVFRLMIQIEKLNREITKVVRDRALEDKVESRK